MARIDTTESLLALVDNSQMTMAGSVEIQSVAARNRKLAMAALVIQASLFLGGAALIAIMTVA